MPPSKPIYRPRNLILFTLAILGALLGREIYLAMTAKPGHAIDYAAKMADLIESNQPANAGPDAPDAWPVFRDIIERQLAAQTEVPALPVNSGGLVLDYSVLFVPHTKPYYDEVPTWEQAEALALRGLQIMRDAGIFESLKELARMRRAVRPTPSGALIAILLPDLGRARQLARMNGARMRKADLEHDETEFVDAYEQTLALGRMMAMQATLIEHLVGIAIVALADGQLREAMTERPLSGDACERLLAAMDRQLPLCPLGRSLEGERLCALDMIQWTHTDDGRGSGRLIMSAASQLSGGFGAPGIPSGGILSTWKIFNLGGIAFPSKAANVRKTNEFYDNVVAYANMPPAQRRVSRFSPDKWVQNNLPTRYLVLRILLPAIEKSIASRTQCDMDVAGTRLMLAIELFNARNGHYPATLDELVPSILPAIPEDPYPAGKFVYRLIKPEDDTTRRADGSARPYLLYTCGADGADNGGKTAQPNEMIALNPSGKGYDLVLNQPKERPKPEPAPEPALPPPPATAPVETPKPLP